MLNLQQQGQKCFCIFLYYSSLDVIGLHSWNPMCLLWDCLGLMWCGSVHFSCCWCSQHLMDSNFLSILFFTIIVPYSMIEGVLSMKMEFCLHKDYEVVTSTNAVMDRCSCQRVDWWGKGQLESFLPAGSLTTCQGPILVTKSFTTGSYVCDGATKPLGSGHWSPLFRVYFYSYDCQLVLQVFNMEKHWVITCRRLGGNQEKVSVYHIPCLLLVEHGSAPAGASGLPVEQIYSQVLWQEESGTLSGW